MNTVAGAWSGPAVPNTRGVRLALGGLSLSMLMASLDTSIANAGLPALATAFGASFQQVQWIVLAYLLAITTLIVGAGRLGDILGRRRLLMVGISLFTLASASCGLALTFPQLVAARAGQGIGAAIMMALTLAFVGDIVPKGKIGGAMGLLGTMSAIGTALGPSLGGLLIYCFGWRAIFLVNVPLGLLSLWLAARYLPTDRPAAKEKTAGFDALGTLVLAATLGSYALAMTAGGGHFGLVSVYLLGVTVLGASLFLLVESRTPHPLLSLSMFRDRARSGSLVASGFVSTVMMATLVVGPFYLSRGLGLGATQVGLSLSVGPAVVVLMGVPAGRIADRFGARLTSQIGLVSMMVGSVALATIPRSAGIAGYLAAIVALTAGYGFFQTSNNAAVMGDVESEERGVISGMLSLSRNLGLITGAAVMGAIFSFASGARDVGLAQPEAVAFGLRVTFGVASLLIGMSLGAALSLRKALAVAQSG